MAGAHAGYSLLRPRKRAKIEPQILVAPLMSVVILLLLFLILTDRFLTPGTPVNLPGVSERNFDQSKTVTVTVSESGLIYLDNTQITPEDLTSELVRLKESGALETVLLRADRKVPFQNVVTALDAVRKAGIEEMAVETSLPVTP